MRSPARREGYDVPDERAFRHFLAEDPVRKADYDAFVASLEAAGVGDVVPAWHLWRQGTDWRTVGEPAFADPPRDLWPAIVPAVELLRDELGPLTGAVEVVSGFRTAQFNAKAGGAPGSRHRFFEAVDVVPKRRWDRNDLHLQLLTLWEHRGQELTLGLGLYDGVRFHVDAWKWRRW